MKKINFLKFIKNKNVKRAIIWFLALVLVLIIVYAIPKISGAFASTYVADYDTVYETDNVECYLVKRETVTYAENSGSANFNTDEGERVRGNVSVAVVGNKSYSSSVSGEISYTYDGYEDYFTEENIQQLTEDKVTSLNLTQQDMHKAEIESGDPLFKTIDDKKWFMVFWMDEDEAKNYAEDDEFEIVLDKKNKVSAKVNAIYQQDSRYMIVLETNGYDESIKNIRKLNIEIIRINASGILLEKSSITTIDGKSGVYVKQLNNSFEFIRVKVLYLVGEKAIVSSGAFTETVDDVTNQIITIKAYDEILKNAKSYNKGGDKN